MGYLLKAVMVGAVLAVATPAMALDRYGPVGGRGRALAVDPDARLERMAAAATPAGSSHARPSKSARSILKDDPNLRAAFAWLDNR